MNSFKEKARTFAKMKLKKLFIALTKKQIQKVIDENKEIFDKLAGE